MDVRVTRDTACVNHFAVLVDGQVVSRADLFLIYVPDGTGAPPTGEIHNVWTHPQWRGRGFARQVMEKAHETARSMGCRTVRLTSHPTKTSARALYLKLGYRPYSESFRLDLTARKKEG